jgi:hypothetical protein
MDARMKNASSEDVDDCALSSAAVVDEVSY